MFRRFVRMADWTDVIQEGDCTVSCWNNKLISSMLHKERFGRGSIRRKLVRVVESSTTIDHSSNVIPSNHTSM